MRRGAPYVWIAALAAGIALGGCGGGSGASPLGPPFLPGQSSTGGSSPIKHVVIVVQENRSFDDFFAHFPGAAGATRGKMKVKVGSKYVDKWTRLHPYSLIMPTDIQHCYQSFVTAYDGGKMDGFNLVHRGVCPGGTKPAGKLVYQYVNENEIQPYWDIANQWVLGDHMFQTQGSGSFTAHQDLIRGATNIDSTESIIDNPTNMPWGCDAPGTESGSGQVTFTSLITNTGKYLSEKGPFPCTNAFPSKGASYTTMRDVLDAKGVSWKYYSPCFSAWNPNGCDNGCPRTCSGALLNAFDVIWPVRNGSEWGTNVSMPETNIFDDISGGTLPAVSWVIPSDENSDHPGEKCGCDDGPSWVASVVNAVGESSYWKSTAIVVVWDDWGGFYDNAVPRQYKGTLGGLGFRVPFLVISPYAKQGSGSGGGFVSHTQYEFGSILRYVEENFNLASLGTTDKRASSIGDVFDYSQKARKFTHIASPKSKEFFLSRPVTAQHGDPE